MIQVHLRLPDEIVDWINRSMEGDTLTERLTNFICSEAIQREIIRFNIDVYRKRLEVLENVLKENPFEHWEKIPKQELEFLKKTNKLMEKGGHYFYGRREAFNNQFNKKITSKEFELLLNRAKHANK